MIITICGGVLTLAWVVHAVRACLGRWSPLWLCTWALGLPLLCLIDYGMFLVTSHQARGGGMAEAFSSPSMPYVVNLFVGLGLWLALLATEPILFLIHTWTERHRRRNGEHVDGR